MSYYHWLGKDAEEYHEAEAYRKAFREDRREADGWETIYPKLN